jgi:hypothetical protein
MSNMLQTIVPKSDQLNSDDLIGQSLTIKVTEVRFKGDDQPVLIHFDGDNGKPYKPCKSMRRVLVHAWGPDANHYVGRSMTLCRDPSVKWAGEAVGGIRISHLSHIEKQFTMALTATRGSRKPYTVDVLTVASAAPTTQPPTVAEYEKCDGAGYRLLEARRKEHYSRLTKQQNTELEAAKKAAYERLAAAAKSTASAQPAGEAPPFDAAKALQDLQTPANRDALDATWSLVVDHYAAAGQDVPNTHTAAYMLSKETFAK